MARVPGVESVRKHVTLFAENSGVTAVCLGAEMIRGSLGSIFCFVPQHLVSTFFPASSPPPLQGLGNLMLKTVAGATVAFFH